MKTSTLFRAAVLVAAAVVLQHPVLTAEAAASSQGKACYRWLLARDADVVLVWQTRTCVVWMKLLLLLAQKRLRMKATKNTLLADVTPAHGAGLVAAGATDATLDRGVGRAVAGAAMEIATQGRGAGRIAARGRKLGFDGDCGVPLH